MIDVAVVDWGTPDLAARCVGSLRSDLFSSIELVDARSRGLTYAQAVNRSLERGSAPFVLALNADTHMLEAPHRVLELFADPQIAVVGPLQVDEHRRITHAGIVGDNLRREHRFWQVAIDDVSPQCSERLLDVPTVSGAVYFCRREIWERFGGFEERCPHYYEETCLDFRVRHAGHRVVYTGETTWEHLWNRSPTTPEWRSGKAAESRAVFMDLMAREGIPAA